MGKPREQRLGEVFVSLADTLVADYDVIDLLYNLSTACVELLAVDTAGIMVTDRKGSLHTKALTIDVGSRRPLVLSAGGLAILIALGKTDMSRALKLNRTAVRQRQRPPGPFEAALRESLRLGFGIYRGPFMPGIQAVGAAAVDSSGRAFGSVSVTDANALRPAGSSWTVPGSVVANAAPASGRVLLGNVQVRTDANVLVGSGDVIVQNVTP